MKINHKYLRELLKYKEVSDDKGTEIVNVTRYEFITIIHLGYMLPNTN